MHSIVMARGLTYEISSGRRIFQNLTFSLDSSLAGLVGPNGIGKTCLARLLAGDLEPTDGVVHRNRPVKHLSQRESPPQVTVSERLSSEYTYSSLGESLLEGIDRNALCTTLSGGQWMRVRLARLLDGAFLILDEPSNDLDREGRAALARFLRDRSGGALLISHDRECLELCETIFELSTRGLERYGGGWSAYAEASGRERKQLSSALDRAKRERAAARAEQIDLAARQSKRSRRGAVAAAKGGMPKMLVGTRKRAAQESGGKRAHAAVEKAEQAVRATREALSGVKVDPVMYADVAGQAIPAQKLVAEASAFNVRFENWIYEADIDFAWRGNVRVAIQGANGSGKSTLLRALRGEQLDTRGRLLRGDITVLYLDQRRSLLDEGKSVLENVAASCGGTESEIRTALARFLFTGDAVLQKVEALSGGERLRAALARAFLSSRTPDLLLLDEPTNDLDVGNVEFLETLVSHFRGALVVVSHDSRFLERCGVSQELLVRPARRFC